VTRLKTLISLISFPNNTKPLEMLPRKKPTSKQPHLRITPSPHSINAIGKPIIPTQINMKNPIYHPINKVMPINNLRSSTI
jgi:hypothetical protein